MLDHLYNTSLLNIFNGKPRPKEANRFLVSSIIGTSGGDETLVPVDALQPCSAERLTGSPCEQLAAVAADQVPDNCPVHQSHRQFKRTGPLHTAGVRTLLEPRLQKDAQRLGEALAARQRVRLSDRHQLLVAVEFPQVLDIPDPGWVAIIDRACERTAVSAARTPRSRPTNSFQPV